LPPLATFWPAGPSFFHSFARRGVRGNPGAASGKARDRMSGRFGVIGQPFRLFLIFLNGLDVGCSAAR
jgi:hypothetical protein